MTSAAIQQTSRPSTETDPLLPSNKEGLKNVNPHFEDATVALHSLIWIAFAAFGFSFMNIAIRLSTTRYDFPISAAVVLPSIVHLTLSSFLLRNYIHVSPLDLTFSNRLLLAARGLFGTAAMVLVFKSLSYLPAGEATAIFAFSPIFTMFLSRLFLNETTTGWDVICAFVGLVGIWLIATPSTSGDQQVLGTVLLFFAACFAAAAYVCVRGMGTQVHFMLSVFALGAVGLPATTILGGKEAFHQLLHNHRGTAVVFIGSLAAFLAQCCLNKGLQSCKAGQGVIIKNLEVPSAYILGLLILNEKPSMLRLIGSAVVISAVVGVGIRKITSR